eukprot:scaffold24134_cov84-Isochrysis_galbana.AAC.1
MSPGSPARRPRQASPTWAPRSPLVLEPAPPADRPPDELRAIGAAGPATRPVPISVMRCAGRPPTERCIRLRCDGVERHVRIGPCTTLDDLRRMAGVPRRQESYAIRSGRRIGDVRGLPCVPAGSLVRFALRMAGGVGTKRKAADEARERWRAAASRSGDGDRGSRHGRTESGGRRKSLRGCCGCAW